MKTDFKIPVVLIMFNRPGHFRKVFEQVKKIRPKEIFIIADGPRKNYEKDIIRCEECKKIVEEIDWECKIYKNYSEVNLGCGRRPATGLDWVFEKVDFAIILEDDCVPQESFFYFCQELLERYRYDDRVISISGNNYQKKVNGDYSYYFSVFPQTWGWATWKRVWEKYDFEMSLWPDFKTEKYLYDIFEEKYFAKGWEKLFQDVYDGKWSSAWDFQFTFLSFVNNGVNIIPNVNLVTNIGFDEMGTHTLDNKSPLAEIKSTNIKFPLIHPKIIRRNFSADEHDMQVVYGYEASFIIRIKNKIQNKFYRLIK